MWYKNNRACYITYIVDAKNGMYTELFGSRSLIGKSRFECFSTFFILLPKNNEKKLKKFQNIP